MTAQAPEVNIERYNHIQTFFLFFARQSTYMETTLFEQAETILNEIDASVIADTSELEQFRIRYLGSKNIIKDVFAEMKNIPNERKKEFG